MIPPLHFYASRDKGYTANGRLFLGTFRSALLNRPRTAVNPVIRGGHWSRDGLKNDRLKMNGDRGERLSETPPGYV